MYPVHCVRCTPRTLYALEYTRSYAIDIGTILENLSDISMAMIWLPLSIPKQIHCYTSACVTGNHDVS